MYVYYVKLLLILWPIQPQPNTFEDVPQIIHTNEKYKFDNTVIYKKAPLSMTKIFNK